MLPSMFCVSMQYDKWKMYLDGSVPFKLLQGKSGKYKYAFNIFKRFLAICLLQIVICASAEVCSVSVCLNTWSADG